MLTHERTNDSQDKAIQLWISTAKIIKRNNCHDTEQDEYPTDLWRSKIEQEDEHSDPCQMPDLAADMEVTFTS